MAKEKDLNYSGLFWWCPPRIRYLGDSSHMIFHSPMLLHMMLRMRPPSIKRSMVMVLDGKQRSFVSFSLCVYHGDTFRNWVAGEVTLTPGSSWHRTIAALIQLRLQPHIFKYGKIYTVVNCRLCANILKGVDIKLRSIYISVAYELMWWDL